MGKKWTILFCVFSMLTFISSLVYNLFLYNIDKSTSELNSNSILANNTIYNKTLITYNKNNTLVLKDLYPSDTITRSVTIFNNNSEELNYKLEWININSTWNTNETDKSLIHPEEFIYNVKCSDGNTVSNKQMPTNNTNNIILDNLVLKTNSTNTCEITIEFLKKEEDQSYNYEKSFRGTYKVTIK